MHRVLLLMTAVTVLAQGLLSPAAGAAGPGAGPVADDGVRAVMVQDGCVSLDQAVAMVRRRIDGEVISAKTRIVEGRPMHYIKIYDRGRVRTVRVGCSGRIL